jgi:hypothetical protein
MTKKFKLFLNHSFKYLRQNGIRNKRVIRKQNKQHTRQGCKQNKQHTRQGCNKINSIPVKDVTK